MKFSYSLVKKLIPSAPPVKKLTEGLTARSFEVESAERGVLEINLPANRWSDAASHIGIAREVSAVFGRKFKSPVKILITQPATLGLIKVEVKEKNLAPRYAARLFEIKKAGKSPLWLQKILRDCGGQPINGIVDTMNYAMLETGQPLHAFDASKISGKIIVRRAKSGERLETLDGKNISLDSETLVIADIKKPLAIAGIKGGRSSGVSGKTRKIIVEAANFDPVNIFKTSRRIGIKTDASMRFGHGISPALVKEGLDRATELLLKNGANLLDSADFYPRPVGEEVIEFDCAKYEQLIGAPVASTKAKDYFARLGFSIEEKWGGKSRSFLVRVPSRRTDIETPEDLMEEIIRLMGYDGLRPEAPAISIRPAEENDMIILKDKLRNLAVSFGLEEVYNHSFVSGAGRNAAELQNPISEDFRYLRPSLEAGLLKNVNHNARFFDEIRIFEIGNVFFKNKKGLTEETHLGLCLGGKSRNQVLELKGIISDILKGAGLIDFETVEMGGVLRFESGRDTLGPVRHLPLPKQKEAAVAEISLTKLLPLLEGEKEYLPLPKFPAVMRDISIIISDEVRIGNILETIQESAGDLAENVDLMDEYTDPKLGGRRSLTFRIVFQSDKKTLTDAEVNKKMSAVSAALKRGFGAETR